MATVGNLQSTLLSKQVIKPSSPTPYHLKTYKLSFSDQFNPPIYIPLIFFYPHSSGSSDHETLTRHQENASKLLKKSLSQTLTEFYPFSGKLVYAPDGSYVDCNDEGVDFEEVRVNVTLSQPVCHPHYHQFFPTGTVWGNTYNNRLVRVQLSYFDCGGLALAVCLSHKIGDLCTLYTFIKHWAAVSHNHYQQLQPPLSQQVVLQPLPPHIISSANTFCAEFMISNKNSCISKRFIFPNSKIEQLKAQVGIVNPTKVEVVNSLLYRCAVSAANANRQLSFYKIFVLLQSVNMRKRLANPLQENTMGNFSWGIKVSTFGKITQPALKSLTTRIQKAKSKLAGTTISRLNRKQWLVSLFSKYVPRSLFEAFTCTSLCGYKVYRVDFGWGKPIGVTYPGMDNYFVLMDTPNEDGIEAVVSLKEEDMVKFEADEQLLAFAYPA